VLRVRVHSARISAHCLRDRASAADFRQCRYSRMDSRRNRGDDAGGYDTRDSRAHGASVVGQLADPGYLCVRARRRGRSNRRSVFPDWTFGLLQSAAGLWIAAFWGFAIGYGPFLRRSRVQPQR
jgi:hypothetical protein